MYRLLSIRKKSTHESRYIRETLLEIYDVEGLPHSTFPLKITTIGHYQLEDTGIKPKLISARYKKDLLAGAGIILIW